ncbi:DNA (cytosine-5-)-methyltransferase [Georgenia yuyongxinii]|uniref:Cytosine-specific methyltransferase n=1 Tax=Georgenia yuyongxinii TaxID=2589797 RepID=A0A552WUY2_9MICO|nr:DNA (cytosine-5-)-methyltransferase [Georgenia yuyongxinii]TRW46369.1 DNA cytosine methyltransferase [Georgenia yuyongxinii]
MFTYVDLFSGIGGFHAALSALGGQCWFASEIDRAATAVYEANWRMKVDGDIVPLTEDTMAVPPHDVLAAGFPCQPFSKSGKQHGMDETRGTLFFNIARVLEERRPTVILLENVRNLAGPRHAHEWEVIVRTLRDLGYRVSSTPAVFSPHLLPPTLGGRPQVRDRVFITGTYVGRKQAWLDHAIAPLVTPQPVDGWSPDHWDLATVLLDPQCQDPDGGPHMGESTVREWNRYRLSRDERDWVATWDDLVVAYRAKHGRRLPGFPLWADEWAPFEEIVSKWGGPSAFATLPTWKQGFLTKNARFYEENAELITAWRDEHPQFASFPPSRRKLEWQAQDETTLRKTIMHFRPSGIRAKRATYVPALVAITQTTVLGESLRRLTPRETARLQSMPDWFQFVHEDAEGSKTRQPDAASYKQAGNGVNVGAAYYVLRQHVIRDQEHIAKRAPGLVEAVLASAENPDPAVERLEAAAEHEWADLSTPVTEPSEASPVPVLA